jgi:hypothetical protein
VSSRTVGVARVGDAMVSKRKAHPPSPDLPTVAEVATSPGRYRQRGGKNNSGAKAQVHSRSTAPSVGSEHFAASPISTRALSGVRAEREVANVQGGVGDAAERSFAARGASHPLYVAIDRVPREATSFRRAAVLGGPESHRGGSSSADTAAENGQVTTKPSTVTYPSARWKKTSARASIGQEVPRWNVRQSAVRLYLSS